jgi:transposase
MKREQLNTKIAGVDVGKAQLDIAIHGGGMATKVANTPAGISELVAWLRQREVGRVGMEASGGYERGVREALSAAGFEVVLHQPLEVRLFARLKRLKAKNDRLDAVLIAAATAQVDAVKAAADPRLTELAERLTAYEQISDMIAQMKTQMEHKTLKDITRMFKTKIRGLETSKAKLIKDMLAIIETHPDLAARLKLLRSLPGVGPVVGVSMLVRMPELGAMAPGQASSLAGVAPFDHDSGKHKGQRFISGGRSRPRRMLYLAALAARGCDPGFKAFAERLAAKGKEPKVILVAIMRKLIEAANLVLARQRPWEKRELVAASAPSS